MSGPSHSPWLPVLISDALWRMLPKSKNRFFAKGIFRKRYAETRETDHAVPQWNRDMIWL
jgi:hypothetical protein